MGVQISSGNTSGSEVPTTFNLYAERYGTGQCATPNFPFATRKLPRVRFSYAGKDGRRYPVPYKVTPMCGTNSSSGGPAFMASDPANSSNTGSFRVTPRPNCINRVGMLKLVEKARNLAAAPDLAMVS